MKYSKDMVVYIPTYHDFMAVSNAIYKNNKMGLKTILGIGRFKGFTDLGYDKTTVDFCNQNKIDYFYHEPMYEEEVLSIAFNMAHVYGYKIMFLLGSDCWLEGDPHRFRMNIMDRVEDRADIFRLRVVEHSPDDRFQQKEATQPMVYFRPGELDARHNHWLVYRKTSKYVLRAKCVVEGLTLHHDTSLRSPDRNRLMEQYQYKNIKREAKVYQEKVKSYKLF